MKFSVLLSITVAVFTAAATSIVVAHDVVEEGRRDLSSEFHSYIYDSSFDSYPDFAKGGGKAGKGGKAGDGGKGGSGKGGKGSSGVATARAGKGGKGGSGKGKGGSVTVESGKGKGGGSGKGKGKGKVSALKKVISLTSY